MTLVGRAGPRRYRHVAEHAVEQPNRPPPDRSAHAQTVTPALQLSGTTTIVSESRADQGQTRAGSRTRVRGAREIAVCSCFVIPACHTVGVREWLEEALTEAVRASWDAGCPVAGGDQRQVAAVARRRLQTFTRRAKKSEGRTARLNDLTKGLVSALEPDPRLVGRVVEDYRYLAEQLLEAYDLAPWRHACELHSIGALRTVTIDKAVSFGLFVTLPETEIPGLIALPNLPQDEADQIGSITTGSQVEARVIAHPEHQRQIRLSRLPADLTGQS